MLLGLLIWIFTNILKSRWNSILLGEQEYEGNIAWYLIVSVLSPRPPHLPHMSCSASGAGAIDG